MDKRILSIFIIGLLLVVIATLGTMPLTGNAVKTDFKGESLCNNDSILIDLAYNGNFEVLNKTLSKGCVPNYLHKADERYSYDLEGGNQSLYRAEFNPALIYSDADVNGSIDGGVNNADMNIVLASPSLETGDKVGIFDNNTKILEINVYYVGAKSCRIE